MIDVNLKQQDIITDNHESVVSVSDFNQLVNKAVLPLKSFWVEGEVTNFKNWKDRWVFFSLKDETAILDCNLGCFRLNALGIILDDGMKIRVTGSAELKKNGRFTINVDRIRLQGEGALKKAYELLKKKLENEGLFVRKRPIAQYIENIGIITSKGGVVIYDFLNNLKKLHFKIYHYDTRVEGEEAVSLMVEAIEWFNSKMPNLDVIVITRGGGSLEDLQPFNNEVLARAIFASKIPTICGIGHDVNVPIASLVADLQVSTPTAVAVVVNKSWENLFNNLPYLEEKILNACNDTLSEQNDRLQSATNTIFSYFNFIFNKFEFLRKEVNNIFYNILQLKAKIRERSVVLQESIIASFQSVLKDNLNFVASTSQFLRAVDPKHNLKLGYCLLYDNCHKLLKNVNQISIGQEIKSKLFNGDIYSKVNKKICQKQKK